QGGRGPGSAVVAAEYLLAVAGPRQARPGPGAGAVRAGRGAGGRLRGTGGVLLRAAYRLMDGSTTDVPDSKANDAFFGRPSNQSRNGAFPQVRWVVAAESGTGSLLGAAMGGYRTAEQPLARELLGCLGPGTLVL